jgi:hypothetical protein
LSARTGHEERILLDGLISLPTRFPLHRGNLRIPTAAHQTDGCLAGDLPGRDAGIGGRERVWQDHVGPHNRPLYDPSAGEVYFEGDSLARMSTAKLRAVCFAVEGNLHYHKANPLSGKHAVR